MGQVPKRETRRNKRIVERVERGEGFAELAKEYKLSRQRIRNIYIAEKKRIKKA